MYTYKHEFESFWISSSQEMETGYCWCVTKELCSVAVESLVYDVCVMLQSPLLGLLLPRVSCDVQALTCWVQDLALHLCAPLSNVWLAKRTQVRYPKTVAFNVLVLRKFSNTPWLHVHFQRISTPLRFWQYERLGRKARMTGRARCYYTQSIPCCLCCLASMGWYNTTVSSRWAIHTQSHTRGHLWVCVYNCCPFSFKMLP